MSIVRMGMAEDNKFGDGWDAIFNKKASAAKKAAAAKAEPPKPAAKPDKKATGKKK